MHEAYERSELIRAVTKRGEAVTVVAARLGIPLSTAYRWVRLATATTATPMFVEVVPERAARATIVVRVGGVEIEVRAGFDAQLLREVTAALGADA